MPAAPRSSRYLLLVLAVAAAASLPYCSSIDDYFLQDDFGVVQLLVNRPWSMFPRWFTVVWMENIWGGTPDEIRPFVALTYQLSGKWTPHRPELHHIVNIAFHAANALLVMAIARRAAQFSPVAAAFAGMIFAVLPSQVESVAWITGRVDGMPTFFYLSTLLAYATWRLRGGRSQYAASLVLFFVALFSKQNAITMTATLAVYDLVVLDRERRGTPLAVVKALLPFVVMTAGYLALRRVVLGQAVRGGVQSWTAIEAFTGVVQRHLLRVTTGHLGALSDWEIGAALVIAGLVAFSLWVRHSSWRTILCFTLAWWAIGVAPLIVVGYESPRHVYLASAAWAFLLGVIADAVYSRLHRPALRIAVAAAATAILGVYLVRLYGTLEDWRSYADISKAAVDRVREEAETAPEGTLLLMDVPIRSWQWAVPFVQQPPYQREDRTIGVRLVTPWRLYCCGPDQWNDYARRQIEAWMKSPSKPPLIAVHFASGTGAMSRATDATNPELRELMPVFLRTDTPQALDHALAELLQRIAGRQQ